ncbi:hypothetical protein QBC34DRAFT_381529 [Podospora aff. communis PSN243]|uniref:F-box domain-containing protein n=1 Tax=Podospora aff. communis PSN243 TaxID=3040156 RepID=A0AAV9GIX8_9PEZI|nr:hypothetical protein QBC34DRAFT_381529 [Podospora aff. communis PSN243]
MDLQFNFKMGNKPHVATRLYSSNTPTLTHPSRKSGQSSSIFAGSGGGFGGGRTLGTSAGSSSSRLPGRWYSAVPSTTGYPSEGSGEGSAIRASKSSYDLGKQTHSSSLTASAPSISSKASAPSPTTSHGPSNQAASPRYVQFGAVKYFDAASNNVQKPGNTTKRPRNIRNIRKRRLKPPLAAVVTTDADYSSPDWKSAAAINARNSPLYALPVEILVQITQMLDSEDKYVLRATSSLFLKLFGDSTFRPDWQPRKQWSSRARVDRPWQYSLSLPAPASWNRIERMRQQDLCEGCMTLRTTDFAQYDLADWRLKKDQRWKCHRCNETHNETFFTAGQLSWPAMYTCIGRVGAIRLCAHRQVRWNELHGAGPLITRRGKKSPYIRTRITCTHPSHARNAGVIRELMYPGRLDKTKAPPCYPTLTILRKLWGSKGQLDIVKRNTVYLFDIDYREILTLHDVKEIMQSLTHNHDKYDAAQLCPHVTFSSDILLQAFWPSRCACFGMHAPLPWQGQQRALDVLPDRFEGDPNGVPLAECLAEAQRDPSRVGKFLQPGAVHTACCRACKTAYFWRLEGTRVYLDVLAEAEGVSRPLDTKWLTLVHPETWGVKEDSKTKGVLWCNGNNCVIGTKWEEHARLDEARFSKG